MTRPSYLYGPGRREEHTDPHIVVGYSPPADLEPSLRANGSRDFRRLTGLLRLPHDALGKWGYAKPVWHCSMRAAPEDRLLSDAEWAQIAQDVMTRTGLCPRGQEDEAVRWIAIRPGHRGTLRAAVHRPGRPHRGPLPHPRRDRQSRTSAPGRVGPAHPAPPRLHRRRLHRQHHRVLRQAGPGPGADPAPLQHQEPRPGHRVRRRPSRRHHQGGEPVWYGGGKLAADLSWPRLQQRWTRPARPDTPLTPGEADALWQYAARTAADATDRIRFYMAAGNPAAAADAACAASDGLHVAAAALGSRALRRAADELDRASRQPWGRIPAPTPAGNQLRHAARLISAYAYLTGDRTLIPMVLLVRLAALAEAIAELRESQQCAAQAAAALRAARHLHTATRPAPTGRPPGRPATATTPPQPKPSRPRPANAADLAQLSFPSPPRPSRPAPSQPGPGPHQPPPPHKPPTPRPRGPTR